MCFAVGPTSHQYGLEACTVCAILGTVVKNDRPEQRLFRLKYVVKYVEIKCQLDATEVFIADLIACSTCFGHHYAHHQELKSII